MVIYVEIHKMFFVIDFNKTMVSTLNSKVNNSIFIIDLLNFECLVKVKGIFKMYFKFNMCIVIYGWQCIYAFLNEVVLSDLTHYEKKKNEKMPLIIIF